MDGSRRPPASSWDDGADEAVTVTDPEPERGPAATDGERILVWAPTGRDAAVTKELLDGAGFLAVTCASAVALCHELERGAAAVIVADEALGSSGLTRVACALERQPPWSDLPLIVLTRPGTSAAALLDRLVPVASVTALERPARLPTLRGAVSSALRARRRQYEVRDLLQRLAGAERRKDERLLALAEELRSPLAAIRNAATLLDQASDPRAERLRGMVERQSHTAFRTLEALLDAARACGELAPAPERVDLNRLVVGVAQAWEGRAREVRLALTVSTAARPVVAQGDPLRLQEAVSDLLSSALERTPDGGALGVSVEDRDGRACVEVTDAGLALEPAALPVARRIAELHGGELVVEGASSRLLLPLVAATRPRPRILLVEDNQDIRECLADLLTAWGWEVAQAADGEAGLALLLGDPPPLAIVDVGLPKVDGYDIARATRARFGPQRVRLIAMTGYGQPQDRERALQAGFDEHLVKPVSPDALAKLLGPMSGRRTVAG